MWNSQAVKAAIGQQFLFDGNLLAWSLRDLGDAEKRILVDLDKEQNRKPGKKGDQHRVTIRRTKRLDLSVLETYLNGGIDFDNAVLEAINFMDHLLRETPTQSSNFITVKRQFFTRQSQKASFPGGIEVLRGVYQSLRIALKGSVNGRLVGKLVVNLDVANCCFWSPTSLLVSITHRHNARDPMHVIAKMKSQKELDGVPLASPEFRVMDRTYRKMKVIARFKGQPESTKERVWTIHRFLNVTAKDFTFDDRDKISHKVTKTTTMFDYFHTKYGIRLLYWQLPLVEMTKGGVAYPIEFLHLIPHQRYLTKLDEKQTSEMIKFAVSKPNVRMAATNEGKNALNWAADPVMNHFGLRIAQEMQKTRARLLKNPKIQFGGSQTDPGTSGRWDLRNKRFLTTNPQELYSWAVGVFPGKNVEKLVVDNFIQSFVKAYRNHGGKVSNPQPYVNIMPPDAGQAVEKLWVETGNKFQRRAQILIFIVQSKDAWHYTRLKKSCDCRYGVVSQVMQYTHVQRNSLQYISNVLMKFNAKLGGTTSQAVPNPKDGSKAFNKPTMVLGADVSHASPGSEAPSTAALTMSLDKFGGRYAAAVETNGKRVEMITEENFKSMFAPLARHWASNFGGRPPQQVYYFRDGVSEGQYAQVLMYEVPRIRQVLATVGGGRWEGKITVIICSKRHHIRVYPEARNADRNGNCLPGLLVERDVTSPSEWDFYLYSHIALQGTSRPVHYAIILDEIGHDDCRIQNMVYEHCYQYMRSTTSVSLFPAVYYAHLASNRAKSHEDIASSEGPQQGPGYKQNTKVSPDEKPATEVPPLMKMGQGSSIEFSMWYI